MGKLIGFIKDRQSLRNNENCYQIGEAMKRRANRKRRWSCTRNRSDENRGWNSSEEPPLLEIEGEITLRNLHYWKSRAKLLRGSSTPRNQGWFSSKEPPHIEIEGKIAPRNLHTWKSRANEGWNSNLTGQKYFPMLSLLNKHGLTIF